MDFGFRSSDRRRSKVRLVAVASVGVAVLLSASVALATSLTPSRAEEWYRQYLTEQFGHYHGYVHCANIFEAEDGSETADCWAHIKSGTRFHLVLAGPTLDPETGEIALPAKPFHRSWVRRWRRAGSGCMRQTVDPLPLKGKMVSNEDGCAARLAIEVSHGRTALHGTGTGSFTPVTLYRCKEHARAQKCFNQVGDGFRYTFPRLLECGNNTGNGWTLRRAQGAGKWNLTTRKVQCTPARGFVDNLAYGRPHREGVSWTARTRYWGTYRCTYLDLGYEYADIRCTAKRGRVIRWQEGA